MNAGHDASLAMREDVWIFWLALILAFSPLGEGIAGGRYLV